MADYKIKAVGLTTPPTPGYVTAYRPAVAVQNLGTKSVVLTGSFRVYERVPPGRLLFSCSLSLADLPAGVTRDALGDKYWTPPAAGSYTIQAHIDGGRPGLFSDFGPYLLPVSSSPPPPPPIVIAHATQHEDGGTDELHVDGLRGELNDDQPPKDHAGKHEQGGADELSVSGLKGQLAEPQPTAPHWNEKHTLAGASLVDLANHNTAETPHGSATNLEKVANKNQIDGYAGLNGAGLIPPERLAPLPQTPGFFRSDSSYQPGAIAIHDNQMHDPQMAALDPWGMISSLAIRKDAPQNEKPLKGLFVGQGEDCARSDHQHGFIAGILTRCFFNLPGVHGETIRADVWADDGWPETTQECTLRAHIAARITSSLPGPSPLLTVRLRIGKVDDGIPIVGTVTVPFGSPLVDAELTAILTTHVFIHYVYSSGIAMLAGTPPGSTPVLLHVPHAFSGLIMTGQNRIQLTTELSGPSNVKLEHLALTLEAPVFVPDYLP